MSGLSDKLTNVDKLKGEKQKLQHALELERTRREALQSELLRLQVWTEKIIGPTFGGLLDAVSATRGAVERMSSRMSEQLDQLNTVVGGVETAVGNIGTNLAAEIEQVRLELERLNNQNPNVDLSGPIGRLTAVQDTANGMAEQVKGIIADAVPEPPVPTPTSKR